MNPLLSGANSSFTEHDNVVKPSAKARSSSDEPRQSFKDTFDKQPKVTRNERSENDRRNTNANSAQTKAEQKENSSATRVEKTNAAKQQNTSSRQEGDAKNATAHKSTHSESTAPGAEGETAMQTESVDQGVGAGASEPFDTLIVDSALSAENHEKHVGLLNNANGPAGEGMSLRGLHAEALPAGAHGVSESGAELSVGAGAKSATLVQAHTVVSGTDTSQQSSGAAAQATVLKSSIVAGNNAQSGAEDFGNGAESGRRAFEMLARRSDSATNPLGGEPASADKDTVKTNTGLLNSTMSMVNKVVTTTPSTPEAMAGLMEKLDSATQAHHSNQSNTIVTHTSQPSLLTPSGIPNVSDVKVQMPISITFGQQGWANMVAERSALMAAQSIKFAELQLDPPELGPLQVKVTVNQDQATVSFVAANPQVKDALDQSVLRLKEMLEEQGLNLVDVDVSDQSSPEESDAEEENHLLAGEEDAEMETEPDAKTVDAVGTYGVDHYA